MSLWEWAVIVACGLAAIPAGLRWLRVAQREHYLPPAATRFAGRWGVSRIFNSVLGPVAAAATAGEWLWPGMGLLTAVIKATGPIGLGLRGSTGPLVWTKRLIRVTATTSLLMGGALATAVITGQAGVAAMALVLIPILVDLALAFNAPLEKALGNKWVKQAARRLGDISPRVVAITGSYGKTSTKLYVTHLLAGSRRVVASPASFNNRMGLARAINERLTAGTEIFVAEMGTYGPGEIADLCGWIPPEVAVITAIGPVHLERMRTEERIIACKSEILTDSTTAVIGVDHAGLSKLAETESHNGRRVVRCSGDEAPCEVGVHPRSGDVTVGGKLIGKVDLRSHHPLNVAAALGAVLALGIDPEDVADRLETLPSPDHRLTALVNEREVTVIDDTFNANPAGAKTALRRLVEQSAPGGKRVVVTPGLVEMGPRRRIENRALGEVAAQAATHLLVVGRTNRRDLLQGSMGGKAQVLVLDNRLQAVRWARANLDRGDTILYENDLPDHYP